MAYKLESVDLILMGAEAVLKNAGIVNKVLAIYNLNYTLRSELLF